MSAPGDYSKVHTEQDEVRGAKAPSGNNTSVAPLEDKAPIALPSNVATAAIAATAASPASQPDHSTFCTTSNDLDPGLSANVVELSETPVMFLNRVLGENEQVLATFDVKFPGEFIPLWKIVLLCIVTCGLYSIVLMYRWIRRCCYRWRCCTPALVSFSFGKMAITNHGRVICWEEQIEQKKVKQKSWIPACCKPCCCCCICMGQAIVKMFCRDTCQAPVKYKTVNFSRIYRAKDIRQVSQFFTSEAMCLFCCLDYSCGIEVAFNTFNHGTNHLQIAAKHSPEGDYGEVKQAAATTSSLGAYWNWARTVYDKVSENVDIVEGAFGGTSNLKVLKILSNTGDSVHNGDVDGVLRDLALLHKKLLACLPAMNDAIVPTIIDDSSIKLPMER